MGEAAGVSGQGGAVEWDHRVLKSLLGAWALRACGAAETAAVEAHLSRCGGCAEEALRLRDAADLLHPEDSLDLDDGLRARALAGCFARRPARTPVPPWAVPFDAETARLDALLRDMAEAEWSAPVQLDWFDGRSRARRETTVAGVLAHLLAVDGLVAGCLGLPDPAADGSSGGPDARTEQLWRAPHPGTTASWPREAWREQTHAMVRQVSFAGAAAAGLEVSYGDFSLPLRDAFLDRAFECWMHGEDIAHAVEYPYAPPAPQHLQQIVALAAGRVAGALAERRRTGLAGPPRELTVPGAPGRALRLEVEGPAGGTFAVALDSPAADAAKADPVAHVALDAYEFCRLVAGREAPEDLAVGQQGDREAIADVLYAAASLSRM